MKFLGFFLIALLAACSTTKNTNHIIEKDIAKYKQDAANILLKNKNKASTKELRTLSLNLIEQAKPIMNGFKKNHSACTELMNFVIGKSIAMTNLSLSEIEDQFHSGSALPEAPEVCFEAKELIVHPATVAIITNNKKLSKENREQINDEIEEVLAHIDGLTEL